MEQAEFVRRIDDAMCPEVYGERIDDPPGALELLLWMSRGPARYALAVASWDPEAGAGQLANRRAEVKQALRARWCLREVGLYLILCGPWDSWTPPAGLKPDLTGLHAVIVQCIHLVDLRQHVTDVRQSRWGPVTFGGTGGVAAGIERLIDGSGAHDAVLD